MFHLSQPVKSSETARQLCLELFGFAADVALLPGYEDVNFDVTDRASGERFVLKLANPATDAGALALENAAMRRVAAADVSIQTPLPVTGAGNEDVLAVAATDGSVWQVRLVTFVDGTLWSQTTPAPAPRLRALGRAMAEVAAALVGLEHGHLLRDVAWDIHNAPAVRDDLALIGDDALRAAATTELDRFEQQTLARLDGLPQTLIHNDANDNNLLLDADGNLAGLLDFGDMVHTWRIADLAVAGAYVCQGWD